MATNESWVLDGVALTGGNFDILELNDDPPKARPDWVSSSDSENAALMRQPLHENRVITMKLRVAAQASMNAALDQVGIIRDKCRLASATPDGIALVWTAANSTRAVTFDVLAGEIPEMPIGLADHGWSWFKQRPIFTLELTCEPYHRAAEVTTSTSNASAPITTIEVASVTGDVPALGRLIITDAATQNRRYMEWGLENQYYNSGTSLIIDSDNMVTSGFSGTQVVSTGAYDPNASGNNSVSATLYSIPTGVVGTGNLSHVGSFRVRARVQPQLDNAALRLAWRAGDGPLSYSPFVSAGTAGLWADIDLGTIHIPPVLLGTQRWTGTIEAFNASGGQIAIDYLTLMPLEYYGRARAAIPQQQSTLIVASDGFTGTTSGSALNARVAPTGGTWATSGATTDFAFSDPTASTEAIQRSTTADAGYRFAVLGATSYTDMQVSTYMTVTSATGTSWANAFGGVIARWVDSSNYLRFIMYRGFIELDQVVAGVGSVLGKLAIPDPGFAAPYLIRVTVYASGRVSGDVNSSTHVVDGRSSALATGGALASGKPGILDQQTTGPAATRTYDDFYATTITGEPIVCYSGRSMQVRYDDTIRQDSTATYYGRPQSYNGSRFLVPPGTSRVAVKMRRDDIDVVEDSAVTDSTTIQVAYQPRGLVVPR